ncbi:MAG: hypothetical protein ICV59_00145 [Thermoleophilia bacterium]|nr:hypothetical protein [Thermoleophilia bacterium]
MSTESTPLRRRLLQVFPGAAIAVVAATLAVAGAQALAGDPLDPAHNVALPCEALATPGQPPRSAKNIAHLANVCGFVGTDVEFQSRTDASGKVRDYAFLGTMGAGMRIFDITDPAHPTIAGGYVDPGWQNDVSVRGDTAVIAFDPVNIPVHASACLKEKNPTSTRGGVDVVKLTFDPQTAKFTTSLVDCYLNAVSGGAHTITLHPSGTWLAVNTSASGVEVVDLRGATPVFRGKILTDTGGTAHDSSFSRDGNTMYLASPSGPGGVGGTFIVDVSNVLAQLEQGQQPLRIAWISENALPGGANNRYNLTTDHQADVSSDGRIVVFTDERGGGLSQTQCNTGPDGIIGGAHFYTLEPIDGKPETATAAPSNPVRLGTWFYPNPLLAADALEPVLAGLGRTERACTIHVFRNGGNGTAGPGPIQGGFDGVSSLRARELVSAHYGAGVWRLDFSGAPSSTDGIAEDQFTDWGNTLGWNVMPGADTWSAKEYKGYVYAGDMARGFDVYRFKTCDGANCISLPPINTPGKATGGGQVSGELAELSILRGTAAGGRANFGFNAAFAVGAPTGQLTYVDHGTKMQVKSTSIDSFVRTGNKATFTGTATVNGVPGVSLFVEVEDFGEPGSVDTFRMVLGNGYGAGGVLLKGNIQVGAG